ncbi:MAG: response regulator transcription factor [Bacteroidetes bacterium]|jgi:DNA-binding NarL/FixJ family response regulator|nr:response regulator transcription factor [Bacteroidota bacterium]
MNLKKEDKPIKVILADDNKTVLESVQALIKDSGTIQLVAAYGSAKECLENIEKLKPDVVLMDIDMPLMTGIEAVKIIRKSFPGLPILMLTGFEDDDKVFNSICAGANGYILKNASMESLLHHIQEVHTGGAPMTPTIARKVLNAFAKSHTQQNSAEDYKLSNREKDVLELLVKGKSYKMISTQLNISYETVHSHIRRIYQKLQVHSVSEAVSKTIIRKILGS